MPNWLWKKKDRDDELQEEVPAPKQEVPKHRVLQFICSESGVKFSVLTSRKSARGRFTIDKILSDMSPEVGLSAAAEGSVLDQTSYDIADFDLTGWKCICGWSTPKLRFARCGKCKDLVCARLSYTKDGDVYFKCHSGCGADAKLSGKPITGYNAVALKDAPKTLTENQRAKPLPAPPITSLPAKK